MPWEDALLGPFVESEPMERRRAEEAVVRELEVVDLRDERGPHPDLHGLRHVRFLGERALVLQGHGHPEDLLSNRIAESGPRTPAPSVRPQTIASIVSRFLIFSQSRVRRPSA